MTLIPRSLLGFVPLLLIVIQATALATPYTGETDTNDARTCLARGQVKLDSQPEFLMKPQKENWSDEDEALYSKWVKTLGSSKCSNLTRCLQSKDNFLRDSNDKNLKMYTDCADLPYQLRAYFAWKKRLPFTYTNHLEIKGSKESGPERSLHGNSPIGRVTYARTSKPAYFNQVAFEICRDVNSGSLRMHPNPKKPGADEITADFYAVELTPSSVRPGTVMYNPNGHVAVVYDVDAMGRVKLWNAHPGDEQSPLGYMSRTSFGPSELGLSSLEHGHGFKNFRPYEADGNSISLVKTPHDFSLEQYEGRTGTGQLEVEGTMLDYFQYVRARLGGGLKALTADPEGDLKVALGGLCSRLKDRILATNNARETSAKKHPSQLPNNIFSSTSSEEWEAKATSGRDTRLRKAVLDLRAQLERTLKIAATQGDLAKIKSRLRTAFKAEDQACEMNYVNSQGSPTALSLLQVIERITRLSFDPYHCPEMRWGDHTSKTCPKDEVKLRWYKAEQLQRNMFEADNRVEMNYSLSDLENGGDKIWGQATSPPIAIWSLLE